MTITELQTILQTEQNKKICVIIFTLIKCCEEKSRLLFNLQNIVANSFNEGSYLSNDIIVKIVDRACDKYLAGDNFVLYGNASDFTNVLYDTIKETLLDAIAALKNEDKNNTVLKKLVRY